MREFIGGWFAAAIASLLVFDFADFLGGRRLKRSGIFIVAAIVGIFGGLFAWAFK